MQGRAGRDSPGTSNYINKVISIFTVLRCELPPTRVRLRDAGSTYE
jgi:hypothetical protein